MPISITSLEESAIDRVRTSIASRASLVSRAAAATNFVHFSVEITVEETPPLDIREQVS